MPYLGNTPTTQSFISGTDYFNGTGSQTAFTLSRTVASINDIQVTVNNVVQQPNDAYTISGTTLTMTSAPSSGTNNVYVRYLSTTTQAITPSQGTVSWNTLDSNIQQDLGVMYKNKIINGAMTFDQRNAGASVSATNGEYTLDRYNAVSYASPSAVTNKFTVQQNAGSVTPPPGFTNYLGVTSSAATTVNTGDVYTINQVIEGFNIADLAWGTANAKTVTLSFWVRSSLTGTFGGALNNNAGNYNYPYTYTIFTANTWEYKTITISGPTAGTWLTNNGIGVSVRFGLGAGTTWTEPAGTWATSFAYSADSCVNVVSTNGATWYLTGVQLEVGTQATTFTTAGGSYGAELALCQRYYQKIFGQNSTTLYLGRIYAPAAGNGAPLTIDLKVSMRTAPTGTIVGTWQIFNSTAQPQFSGITTEAVYLYVSATGAGDTGFYTDSASVGANFSAEL
jgi:hypothetical protein